MPHPYTYEWSPQVAVGSANNVWLTGDNKNPAYPLQAGTGWALHWNGKSWSQTRSSDLDASPGVAALAGSNGLWLDPDEEWNGSSWLNQAPNPLLFGPASLGGVNPDLIAISAIPGSGSIWGAGSLSLAGDSSDALMASFATVP